jgi:hypothetical protein
MGFVLFGISAKIHTMFFMEKLNYPILFDRDVKNCVGPFLRNKAQLLYRGFTAEFGHNFVFGKKIFQKK